MLADRTPKCVIKSDTRQFDNARRLRELITELEARSLRAFLDAEG